MKKTLIIGYGNPLRGDDGIGWVAARELLERYAAHRELEVLTEHQLTPELAVEIPRFERVILIDAGIEGKPGNVECQRIDTGLQPPQSISHHLSPQSLLVLAQECYQANPEAYLITITGENFGYVESLSETINHSLQKVYQMIEDLLSD
jgi:hydrogenase maturation protease